MPVLHHNKQWNSQTKILRFGKNYIDKILRDDAKRFWRGRRDQ